MSKLPTIEQAERWLDKCMHCGCTEYSEHCNCVIDCHGMAAMAVIREEQRKKL